LQEWLSMGDQFQEWKIGLAIIIFIFPWNLYAKSLTSELSLSSQYSSNIFKNNMNKASDIKNRVQFKVNKVLTEGSLDSFIRGYSGYDYYQRKSISNRVSSDVSTHANYHFLPDRFSWFMDDRLSDVLINSSLANIPGNQQRKNIFRSGPQYTFLFSRTSRLVTSLEYINTQYQTLGGDSTRYRLGNQFEHNVNADNTLGLGFDLTRISFSARPDMTSKLFNASYTRNKGRDSIIAETGYTQYITDKSNVPPSSTQRTGSITWKFSWNRQINELSKFSVEFQRALTDTSGDAFLFSNNLNFNYTKSNKVKITDLKVQYDINLGAGKKLSTSLLSLRKQYVNSFPSEDRSSGVYARFNFPISTFLSATTGLRYQILKFAFSNQKNKLISTNFNLIYKMTRQLYVQFNNGYDKQTSNILARQYNNWYSYLGINYSF